LIDFFNKEKGYKGDEKTQKGKKRECYLKNTGGATIMIKVFIMS